MALRNFFSLSNIESQSKYFFVISFDKEKGF